MSSLLFVWDRMCFALIYEYVLRDGKSAGVQALNDCCFSSTSSHFWIAVSINCKPIHIILWNTNFKYATTCELVHRIHLSFKNHKEPCPNKPGLSQMQKARSRKPIHILRTHRKKCMISSHARRNKASRSISDQGHQERRCIRNFLLFQMQEDAQ